MKLLTTLQMTDKGALKCNKDALEKLGWFGDLLLTYRSKRDERKFITALQENQVKGKIHISIKVPGTITGRCSAGKLGG